MTKLILKAVSSPKSAASAAVDQVVGQVDTASGAQRLSISAQANTQYRLVDSKTGQVIKNQTVLRKGKTLQIEVEGKNLVELDNFFPTEATITGGLGNDVLWGLDTFTANAVTDSDTFVWALGDAGTTGAVDIVKDFVAWNSTAGDKLNITSLLAGGYNTSTSALSQWVTVTTRQTVPGSATANSTKIVIDVDGLGAGNVMQTIWLEGVTLSATDAAALKTSGVLIA